MNPRLRRKIFNAASVCPDRSAYKGKATEEVNIKPELEWRRSRSQFSYIIQPCLEEVL